MSKRTLLMVAALVLSMAMVATGTLAYLSDSDKDVNVMTLGNVDILQNEQERTEDGELDKFSQNKPAYPAVGPVELADEGVEIGGTEYPVYTDELENVIDKFVTVTNTGKSDAYIRTIILIEAPEYDPNHLIHENVNLDIDHTDWAHVEIDGVEYIYSVFTYPEALAAGETSVPSLLQLFLDSATTNEDVAKFGDTWEVLALSQAVQTNGFDDAATALDTAFGEVNAENIEEWLSTTETGSPGDEWPNNNPPVIPEGAAVVTTSQELKDALAAKEENIYLEPGTYKLGTFSIPNGTTVFGMGDVTIEGTITSTVKNIVVENVHIKSGDAMRWAYSDGDVTFKNCVLEGTSIYPVHFDGMKGNVLFEDCEIIGWTAMAGGSGHVTFDNCSIKDNGYYGLVRSYGDVDFIDCTFDVSGANTSDGYPEGLRAENCTFELVNCTNVNGALEDLFNTDSGGVYNVQ